MAGRCGPAGTGRNRITTSCRKCCARRARAPRSSTCPGNHDEFLRNYYGTHFGGIDVVEDAIHEGVDGKRYLVIHGDIFDLVVQNARWLAHLGDKAYDFAIRMNRLVNFFRRAFGVPYWSLSQWAKLKVKNAVNYIGAFEQTLAAEARRHGADGVICGHIHYATIRDEHGIRYMNCGDWVESCTALVEHEDGRFEIISWTDPLTPHGAGARDRGAGGMMAGIWPNRICGGKTPTSPGSRLALPVAPDGVTKPT